MLVAAYATWHESHSQAADAVRRGPALIAHAALEAYSVLTRLPERVRAPADLVRQYLEANFGAVWVGLSGEQQRTLLLRLPALGIAGGSVYDALIAATAAVHEAKLLSLDARAAVVYERLGTAYELLV
ncbi:MAG: PIN domain-containing protein [Actinomycetota bacterium]|nr:PIN domain-containing protein [Actinomycetota bacterium]